MRTKMFSESGWTRVLAVVTLCAVLVLGASDAQTHSPAVSSAVSTSFTYQGYLRNAGHAVTAICDMTFILYGQESGGAPVAAAIDLPVSVMDGVFTAELDFGATPFAGDLRWLEIAVQCPEDAAATSLPRQALTASPYSLYSLSTGALQGRPVADTAPATDDVLAWNGSQWTPSEDQDTTYLPGNQLALDGATFNVLEGSGSGLDADMLDGRPVSALAPEADDVLAWDGSKWAPSADQDTTYLPGNQLTLDGTTFNVLEGSGSGLDADTLNGRNLSEVGRLDRYSIPGSGGTVTMTIPHYNAFQIAIGEAFASPNRAAWLTGVENDGIIAWVGIDGSGTIVTGGNVSLSSTTTVITVGANITLRCPGNGNTELVLVSSYEDVRAWVLW